MRISNLLLPLLISLLGFGCKSVKIDSADVLNPQDKIAFVANEPKGAVVHVTIDLKSIVFKDESTKARINLPDLSEYAVISGWFVYNVSIDRPTNSLVDEVETNDSEQ